MSFPRQKAATRNFQLGAPRNFLITQDASHVIFLRSDHGRDPVNSLWVYDIELNVERKLVDARDLIVETQDVPDIEKARRERLRETTSGITSYSASDSGLKVAFALAGQLFFTDVATSRTTPLDVPGPIIDPIIAPDGNHIAWSTSQAVYTIELSRLEITQLTPNEDARDMNQVWGLADFIAAEEFGRSHGMWWLANSSALLIECVDDSEVQQWWLSDPALPGIAPRKQNYPAAGTTNARISLHLCSLQGARTEVAWNQGDFEYLLNVRCDKDTDPIISLSDRSQQNFAHFLLKDSNLELLTTNHDEKFLEVIPGQPVTRNGQLVTVQDNFSTDTRQLEVDGKAVSPAGLQIHSVIAAHNDFADVIAATNSTTREIYRISYTGEIEQQTEGGVSNATGTRVTSGKSFQVVAQSHLSTHTRTFELRCDGKVVHYFENLAENPMITPVVHQLESGPFKVKTAVLFPTNHVMGDAKLPMLLRPYGGPHGAQVLDGALTYVEDQWYADQGFVVIVADGRGTPGRGPSWDRSIYENFVNPVLDDQVEAVRAVAAHFPADVDDSRVGIMGWSFGGYLSALAVMERPDVFHAAVAGAPVTDWLLYDTAYTERYLGHPSHNSDVYAYNSLFSRAANLERPLMLIHGLADDNVVSAHSLKLSGELLAHRKPHSVLPLSGVTHMTPQEVVAENLMFLSAEFIKTHLA